MLPFELLSDVPRAVKKAYEALNLNLSSNIESKTRMPGMKDFVSNLGDYVRSINLKIVNRGLKRIKLSEHGIDKNR